MLKDFLLLSQCGKDLCIILMGLYKLVCLKTNSIYIAKNYLVASITICVKNVVEYHFL